MEIKAFTSTLFYHKKDIPKGTEIIIEGVLKNKKSNSGVGFLIKECPVHPQLIGQFIDSGLVDDSITIIKEFKKENDSVESVNQRVLLII